MKILNLKIYLDSCCFNRPFDDLLQEKVRLECEAVLTIVNNCESGTWDIFRSDVLDDEIDKITNPFKKLKVLLLYSSATLNIEVSDKIVCRARELQRAVNLKPFDSLHLASAEHGGADVLLTTDKKFINRATKSDTKIKIANPAVWLMEVLFNA